MWVLQQEKYLQEILNSCDSHAKVFHKVNRTYRAFQTKLKIPLIVIGSFSGVASFGTSSFPVEWQRFVSLCVGVVSIVIAILGTVESYFKVVETTNDSLNTASALERLRDDIGKELSLPVEDRTTNGITFVRDCYVRYQQIVSQSPQIGIRWKKLPLTQMHPSGNNLHQEDALGGIEMERRERGAREQSPDISESSEESVRVR